MPSNAMDRYGEGFTRDFIACGQFFVCHHLPYGPTDDPRCDLAPVVVGNSWGIVRNNGTFFDEVIDTWIAAGIAPVFAAGNAGTSSPCSTVRAPGNSVRSITIGPTNIQKQITSFSSAEPSHQNVIKPLISAPGEDTVSAGITSDTAYASMCGTSMAAPHVVGLIALLHSSRPNSTLARIEDALIIAGAQQTVRSVRTCGGIPDSEYPNNNVGYGRISAPSSLEALKQLHEAKQI